jgi:hypothetical protein
LNFSCTLYHFFFNYFYPYSFKKHASIVSMIQFLISFSFQNWSCYFLHDYFPLSLRSVLLCTHVLFPEL